jgi:sugar lactone lactonase YvrE
MKLTALRFLVVSAAGLAALLIPDSVHAGPGDLYEADFTANTIFKFTPGGIKTPFITGLNNPRGLAFDGAGNLFEADGGSGMIFKIAPDGTKTTFASGLNVPFALAFDSSGNLFEADLGSNTIFEFAPDGTKTTFATGLDGPRGLAFDATGNLFVAESTGISKIDPAGTKTTFASGLNLADGLALDASGNLFEADHDSNTIFKFAPDGTKTTFATGLNNPFSLAFDSSGNLFVGDVGSSSIFIFTPTGIKSTFASSAGLPTGLAFAPTPHQLFNISTRGFVGTGDAVLIGGFIVTGNGMINSKVLIRAAGPSLTAQGVSGALQDPILRLFDSHGVVITSNDNWKDTQQVSIQATGLAPTDDRESAILASLPSGAYTAIVTGAGNATGIARVDVFNVQ